MKMLIATKINTSAENTWKTLVHDFDSADRWLSAVPRVYGKDLGPRLEGAKSSGRVCELDSKPNGMKAYEHFLAIDEKNMTATIKVELKNAPAVVPFTSNVVEMTIQAGGPNQCTLTWRPIFVLKPMAYVFYPLVKLGLTLFIKQAMDELKYFLENGSPHPRKLKAMDKIKLKAQATI